MIAAPSRIPLATDYFTFETPPATGYSSVRKPAGTSLLGASEETSGGVELTWSGRHCMTFILTAFTLEIYSVLSDQTPSAGMLCS